jgi:hypothetical protein
MERPVPGSCIAPFFSRETFQHDSRRQIFSGSCLEVRRRDVYVRACVKAEAPKTVTSTNLPYGPHPLFTGPRTDHIGANAVCARWQGVDAGDKLSVVKTLSLTGSSPGGIVKGHSDATTTNEAVRKDGQ